MPLCGRCNVPMVPEGVREYLRVTVYWVHCTLCEWGEGKEIKHV